MMDVQRADPRTQRTAVLVIVVGAVVGLALIVATRWQLGALEKFLADNPSEIRANLGIITWGLIAVVVVPVMVVNIYVWRLGSRVVASGVFPPPGMPVIRDTIFLRDTEARRCGRLLQILAAVMCAAAMGLAFAIWRLGSLIGLRSV